ncbi:MAG: signal peptidase I [Planctomycetia bacterium]|nr:signal peptidase I [Planctomycetia bacterium]
MNLFSRGPDGREHAKYPTYKGDRILVAKFPYDFSDPKRWDVAVFKYPQTANENYIKRVIGLPNDTIVIHGGNIYTLDGDGPARTIQRKPPDKVRAIVQKVYDNDYVVPKLVEAGLTARWQPLADGGNGGWQALDGLKSYRTDGSGIQESWLGYRHCVPTQAEWQNYEASGRFVPAGAAIRPQLVSDFYAYNGGTLRGRPGPADSEYPGVHWVGDLIVECELTVEPTDDDQAEAVLRLVKGGRMFDCRIQLATGQTTLSMDGAELAGPGETSIRKGTTHTISLANVDCQLLLWVDGSLVEFPQPATYEPVANEVPTVEDLTPVRIGAKGAGLEVTHLRVLRDVYYIADDYKHQVQGVLSDYETAVFGHGDRDRVQFLSNPAAWPRAMAQMRTISFPLRSDEFLMLGDNSPKSKDSRLWIGRDAEGRPEYFVKRDLLVGKAVFVYWPHSWNRIPGTRIPFPFFPNFARMKFVR